MFNLFTPDGTTSLASTSSSITMVGSSYTDLTFTNNAGLWTTNTGAANQSMSFNSATRTLRESARLQLKQSESHSAHASGFTEPAVMPVPLRDPHKKSLIWPEPISDWPGGQTANDLGWVAGRVGPAPR